MQEDYIKHANAVDGAFNGQPQCKYYQARQPPPLTNSNVMGSSSSDDLREMMKTLTSNTVTLQQNVMSFQKETRSSIHNLEKQMGKVA
jgi:uncharacterized protein YciW